MALLISLLIMLAILAVVWWIITMLGLPPPFVNVAKIVMAIILLLWLLNLLGAFGAPHYFHIRI